MDVWVPSIPILTKEQKEIQELNANYAKEIFRLLIAQLEETPIEDLIQV